MHFQAWGPFEFDGDIGAFWERVDAEAIRYDTDPIALRKAIGCYMFSIKRGDTYKPWYVGKTSAQTGFYGEVLTPHKVEHYNGVFETTRRKSGQLIFFTLITSTGHLSRATRSTAALVNWLERMLIGMAIAKNPDLRNKRDTKLLRSVWVEGVFGKQDPGRPFSGATAARKALL
tara:strand:- start:6047 stop:6568 length:522 start_codon:yes stop_codon:yes gene_type:complete